MGLKRALESATPSEESRDEMKRRQSLCNDIVEAVEAKSIPQISSLIEKMVMPQISSIIKSTVQEVVLQTTEDQSSTLNGRFSSNCVEEGDPKNLKLQFETRMQEPIFTERKLVGEGGAAIKIVLKDADTGNVVSDGSASSLELAIVVLDGDFKRKDDDNWTEDEFKNHVVKKRDGKRELLDGTLKVTLKQGTCELDDLTITDSSCRTRSGKFIIGARVASDNWKGGRIREAITEALTVKHNRGQKNGKHRPPKSDDEVWKLEKIGKNGPFHKALNDGGINTVLDFLQLLTRDEEKLKSILGDKMTEKNWGALIKHARTCPDNGKVYVFPHEYTGGTTLVFDYLGNLNGLIDETGYYSTDQFSVDLTESANIWIKTAYKYWKLVREFPAEDLFRPTLDGSSNSAQAVASASHPCHSSVSGNDLTIPNVPDSLIPAEASPNIAGTAVGRVRNIPIVNLNSCTQKLRSNSRNRWNFQLMEMCYPVHRADPTSQSLKLSMQLILILLTTVSSSFKLF